MANSPLFIGTTGTDELLWNINRLRCSDEDFYIGTHGNILVESAKK